MAPSQPSALQRFILWDYPRASVQYDVIVVLILAFLWFAPKFINFHDQPRPQQVVLLPSVQGANVYWLEPASLRGLSEADRLSRATDLIHRYHDKAPVTRVEVISDPEGEVRGYMAYTKP